MVKVNNMQRWGGEVWSRSTCRGGEGRCGQGQHAEVHVRRGGVVKVSMQRCGQGQHAEVSLRRGGVVKVNMQR